MSVIARSLFALFVVVVCLISARSAVAQFPIQIGEDGDERPLYIISDGSGGFWLVADFTSTTAIDIGGTSLSNRGSNDGFVAHYNSSGVLQSHVHIGGTGTDLIRGIDVDGSQILLCGQFSNTVDFDPSGGTANRTASDGADVFLARYTTAGSFVSVVTMGGTGEETALDCKFDGNGGTFVTGYFEQSGDFDPDPVDQLNFTTHGGRDLFLLRFDGSDDLTWGMQIGGSGHDSPDVSTLVPDGIGGLYIAGYFQGTAVDFAPLGPSTTTLNSGNRDPFISRYDSNGQLVSGFPQRHYETPGSDQVRTFVSDGSGSFLVAGTFDFVNGDPYVGRINASGFPFETGRFTGPLFDSGFGVSRDEIGGFVVTGYFQEYLCYESCDQPVVKDSLKSAGGYDIYVASLASNLDYHSSFSLGGTGDDFVARNPVMDGNGQFYLAGWFQDTIDVDGSPAVPAKMSATPLTSNGGYDIFIARYDTDVFLPIELESFDARVNGSSVNLSWVAGGDLANVGYEIERAAVSIGELTVSTRWTAEGFVADGSRSAGKSSYSFRVDDLVPGTHSFRLKQLRSDGSFQFSAAVEVAVGLEAPFSVSPVYPNPIGPDGGSVQVSVARAQEVSVVLYDLTGRRVRLLESRGLDRAQTIVIPFDVGGLAAGSYLLRVEGETFIDSQPVFIAE